MKVHGLTALAQAAGGEDPRVALRATAEPRRASARMETQLVRRAGDQGLWWAEVPAQLAVSEQAAHREHGGRGLLGMEREP